MTSWWVVPPAQFAAKQREQEPRMIAQGTSTAAYAENAELRPALKLRVFAPVPKDRPR